MNKIVKSLSAVCALFFTIGASGAFVACSGSSSDDGSGNGTKTETTTYTVSFESNGGSSVASQEVKEGEYAVEPDDPTKDGYDFDGWYKETSLSTRYIFSTEAVISDLTLYAGWNEVSGTASDKGTVTFYYNYDYDGSGTANDNGDVYSSKEFTYGKNISKVDAPTREGYTFKDWYTDKECTQVYDRYAGYTEDVTVYAKWVTTYTFEAEYTQLTGLDPDADPYIAYETITDTGAKKGNALSGSRNGAQMIGTSTTASGGKYVAGIYYNRGYIDFEFTSDSYEENVSLSFNFGAEFRVVTLSYNGANNDKFAILVNGTETQYEAIEMDGSEYMDMGGGERTFKKYYINNITIQKGENVIRLLTMNSNARPDGTVKSMAPIVDCMYLTCSATLTFTEYSNS